MPTNPSHLRPAPLRSSAVSLLAALALSLAGPAAAFADRGGGDGGGGNSGSGSANSGRGGADDTPGAGGGGGGGDRVRAEVRATGVCGRGAASWLKLKERDGGIEVEFEVHRARPGALWRLVIVHERRIDYRGNHRTRSTGAMRVSERVVDLRGADSVSARAWGPRGVTCTATAVLPGA